MDKCVEIFDEIEAQVPKEIRLKADLDFSNEDIVVEATDDEDDQPKSSEWEEKRNKKKKMVEVLLKAQQKALQIFPRGSQYFDDIRRRYLVPQASEDEKMAKNCSCNLRWLMTES